MRQYSRPAEVILRAAIIGTEFANERRMARKTGDLPSKAGVKSLSKKLDTSRHGFAEHPHTRKNAGAFAADAQNEERMKNHESASGSTRESKTRTLAKMKKSS
jgi:hypothetical protein